MKNLFKSLFTLCVALALTPASLVAQEGQLEVRVGVYENPPKIYTNEQGKVSGFHADLIRHIGKRLNWKIEFIHGTWTELLEMTRTGKIDIMMDVAFSLFRAQEFTFNKEHVFINWATVYTRPDFTPQTLFDLNGKVIASMENGIHTTGEMGIISLAREFRINITLLPQPDYRSAFEAVYEGKADAAVVNRIFGGTYEKEFGLNRTSIIFNPVSIKYAFPPSSPLTPRLIQGIDQELISLKENNDSLYYQLLDKYLAGYVEKT